jgi:hypothetical protein
MKRIFNVMFFFVVILSSRTAFAYPSNVCSLCKDDRQYCGSFETSSNTWLSGSWYSCVIRPEMMGTPFDEISFCGYCDSRSRYATCGTYNTRTRNFLTAASYRCYNNFYPNPRYTPPSRISDGPSYNLPPIQSPADYPATPIPDRSPNTGRDLGREMQNGVQYGTPYNPFDLNERLSWCTLHGTSGQDGC